MNIGKALLFGITGVAGLGIPATAGAYNLTKETIWNKVSDDAVPNRQDDSLTEAWKKLKTSLSNINNPKDPALKSLKDSSSSDTEGKKLQEWCFTAYEKNFKSWTQSEQNDLLTDVKNACISEISSHIEDNKKFTFQKESSGVDQNKTEFDSKLESLRKHQDPKINLEEKLKELQIKKTDDDWKELEKWCEATYERGFQGKESNRWKLIELYCTKGNGH